MHWMETAKKINKKNQEKKTSVPGVTNSGYHTSSLYRVDWAWVNYLMHWMETEKKII